MSSYTDRLANFTNSTARLLLQTIERKKSNLAVSVDVTSSAEFLNIIDCVGPYVCVVKTHVDILEEFEFDKVIPKLKELSYKHDFLIFEDRKFADIGNTVKHQYTSGVYKIASWSHITNAHPIPGPSIISGLATIGQALGRGLLILAEMSTKGSLATGNYTEEAVKMAREDNGKFVIGFIAQNRTALGTSEGQDFLILTPGVGLDTTGDSLGQQYRTPREVVFESGCDVIIVGRGIYQSGDKSEMQKQAQRYQQAGWEAYLERLSK